MNLLTQFAMIVPDVVGVLPMAEGDGVISWIPDGPPPGTGGVKTAAGIVIGLLLLAGVGLNVGMMFWNASKAALHRGSQRSGDLKDAGWNLLIAVVLSVPVLIIQALTGFITTILKAL